LDKSIAVLKREYRSYVRQKKFWILSFAGPLLYVVLIAAVGFMSSKLVKGQKVWVFDGSGMGETLKQDLAESKMEVAVKPPIEGPLSDAQKKPLQEREADAFVVLPKGLRDDAKLKPLIYTRQGGNLALKEMVRNSLNDQLRKARLEGHGLAAKEIGDIFGLKVEIDDQEITSTGEVQKGNEVKGLLVGFGMVLLVMMPSLIWGMELMRSIIEEKNQRIVEILISSLTPFELLLGKILGIGLVGLTQLGIWVGLSAVITGGVAATISRFGGAAFSVSDLVPASAIPLLLAFFILAFFMYAMLYAAVGSAVNTEKEGQQFAMPIMMVMMVPWFLIGVIIQAPDAPFVVTMSLIPLYTPMLMSMRAGLGTLPLWQGVLGITLTSLTIVFLTWVCSKIYRVGILMYGQKPSLAEVVKWIGRS
jgi:ABC-2 type transport system permease protein